MKHACPLCHEGKARRACLRNEMALVCSVCCSTIRNATCEGCHYFTEAKHYQNVKSVESRGAGEDFIIEVDPQIEKEVDDALVAAQAGRIEPAWNAIKDLYRNHPDNHLVCYGLGVLNALEGDHDQAIVWFDKAVAIYPYFIEALFNIAVAYKQKLDIFNAIHAFRRVVEVGGPDESLSLKAQSFIDDMANAIRGNDGVDLNTYLRSQKYFVEAFDLMERGEWKRALDGFDVCVSLVERNAPTHGNRALCLAQLGRKADALAALDRALAIDSEYRPARENHFVVQKMREGQPMNLPGFKVVNFALDEVHRKDGLKGLQSE